MLKWLTDNLGLITAIVGIINIFAILYSPKVALKLQRKNDAEKEIENLRFLKL